MKNPTKRLLAAVALTAFGAAAVANPMADSWVSDTTPAPMTSAALYGYDNALPQDTLASEVEVAPQPTSLTPAEETSGLDHPGDVYGYSNVLPAEAAEPMLLTLETGETLEVLPASAVYGYVVPVDAAPAELLAGNTAAPASGDFLIITDTNEVIYVEVEPQATVNGMDRNDGE